MAFEGPCLKERGILALCGDPGASVHICGPGTDQGGSRLAAERRRQRDRMTLAGSLSEALRHLEEPFLKGDTEEEVWRTFIFLTMG